jgi:hypothetical protein
MRASRASQASARVREIEVFREVRSVLEKDCSPTWLGAGAGPRLRLRVRVRVGVRVSGLGVRVYRVGCRV